LDQALPDACSVRVSLYDQLKLLTCQTRIRVFADPSAGTVGDHV
jgi:hypothetical protein